MPKRGLMVLLMGVVLLAGAGQVGNRDAALGVIERAIKAHGGSGRVGQMKIMSRKAKGTLIVFENTVAVTSQMTMQLPDKYRVEVEAQTGDLKNLYTHVINGDKGWRLSAGAVSAMEKAEVSEFRENEVYLTWLTTLLPLREKAFDLELAGNEKVNEKEAVGIRVSSKGHAAAKLFFEKQTGLLVKIERPNVQEAGLQVKKEYLFSEFKVIDGVKIATKHIEMTNGKKSTEITLSEIKFPDKLDETLFEKP